MVAMCLSYYGESVDVIILIVVHILTVISDKS